MLHRIKAEGFLRRFQPLLLFKTQKVEVYWPCCVAFSTGGAEWCWGSPWIVNIDGHVMVQAAWETRNVMSGGFWRQWINSAWRGILKDTICLTAGGNKLKINLYIPPSPGKYPEGHAPLFTNQKKLLFRYRKTREWLSGSALGPESYWLLPLLYEHHKCERWTLHNIRIIYR